MGTNKTFFWYERYPSWYMQWWYSMCHSRTLFFMDSRFEIIATWSMTERDHEINENTRSRVKIKSKITNFMKLIRIEGYNGKYGSNPHEIREFLMISSTLIKSDDESVIEIGENGILWKRTWRRIHGIKNQWIWLWFRGEIKDWRWIIFSKT